MPWYPKDAEEKFIRDKDTPKKETEREPVSWRDKDRKKDRSAHVTPDPRDRPATITPNNKFFAELERKSNLKSAEALFANPAKKTLEKKIDTAQGETFDQAVNEFVTAYGWPQETALLIRFLDHSDGAVVSQALTALEGQLSSLSDGERTSLVRSVRLLSMMGKDPAARRAATSFMRRNKLNNVQV